MGIITFASSIGGTVFPVAFRNLHDTVGYALTAIRQRSLAESAHRFKWTMRIIAFVLMFVLGIANLVRSGIAYTCTVTWKWVLISD